MLPQSVVLLCQVVYYCMFDSLLILKYKHTTASLYFPYPRYQQEHWSFFWSPCLQRLVKSPNLGMQRQWQRHICKFCVCLHWEPCLCCTVLEMNFLGRQSHLLFRSLVYYSQKEVVEEKGKSCLYRIVFVFNECSWNAVRPLFCLLLKWTHELSAR